MLVVFVAFFVVILYVQGGLTVDASQLKDSLQAFSIVRAICRRADSSLSDLLAELPVLFQHLKYVKQWISFYFFLRRLNMYRPRQLQLWTMVLCCLLCL